jgi:hypothetical protein
MTLTNFKIAGARLALVVLTGMSFSSPPAQAQSSNDDESKIQQGFAIAPVPLNLMGKNRALVGMGSYLVNAVGDCNGCHTSGGPPNFNYSASHNPYFQFQMPTQVDPANYLAGGADFGPALPFNVGPGAAYGSYVGPDMIARNLTPDKNGMPEGGNTLAQFTLILRTGIDLDHIHPTCTSPTGGPGNTPTPANCIPPPVNGSVLQIMPWPVFHNLTDNDIAAVYEYLRAIPCIDNKTGTPPAGAPNELRNDCGTGAPTPSKHSSTLDFIRAESVSQPSRRVR